MDPSEFTKCNVLELATMPIAAQNFAEDNFIGQRSAHAALILLYLSNDMDRAHPEVTSILNTGFQKLFQHPVNMTALPRHPSVGPNAYPAQEILWCNATIDHLENQLDDEGKAKRLLPAKRAKRGTCAAEDDEHLVGRSAAKIQRKSRLNILDTK